MNRLSSPGVSAIAAAMLATIMVQLDVSVVAVVIADLGRAFSIDSRETVRAINAYTLTFASMLLNAGVLVDRIGTRRSFGLGFAIFTAASLACGLASGWPSLLVAKAIQGAGGALLFPTSLAVIQQVLTNPRARASGMGWWSAAGSAALASGPILGGVLISRFGWRSIFLVNFPIGIFGIWLTAFGLQAMMPVPRRAADPAGQLLGAAVMISVMAFTYAAGRLGWHDVRVVMLAVASVIFLAALIWVERIVARPIFSYALLRSHNFIRMTAIGALLSFAFYGLVFAISLHLQTIAHQTPLNAGLTLAPMMVALIAVNPLAGDLHDRWEPRTVVGTGLSTLIVGCAILAILAGAPHAIAMPTALVLIGVGTAIAIPAMASAALSGIALGCSGTAAGILNAVRQAGGAMGIALFATLAPVTTTWGISYNPDALIAAALGSAGVVLLLVPSKACALESKRRHIRFHRPGRLSKRISGRLPMEK